MELKEGDLVKYTFPLPVNNQKKEFYGTVIDFGENYIQIKDRSNIVIKVSYKNFDFIEKLDEEPDTMAI